jgi:putative membrane protein
MKTTSLVSALILLSIPALAETVGEKTGVNSTLGISPTTQDFVTEAAIGDMFEIRSSQLAVQRADGPTKAFAQLMIADHQKTSAELKAMIDAKTVNATVPADLDATHKKMLDKLGALNGADFIKQYHDDQANAHKGAVSLFKRYGEKGDNAPLKNWAAQTEMALAHHLDMAKEMDM